MKTKGFNKYKIPPLNEVQSNINIRSFKLFKI